MTRSTIYKLITSHFRLGGEGTYSDKDVNLNSSTVIAHRFTFQKFHTLTRHNVHILTWPEKMSIFLSDMTQLIQYSDHCIRIWGSNSPATHGQLATTILYDVASKCFTFFKFNVNTSQSYSMYTFIVVFYAWDPLNNIFLICFWSKHMQNYLPFCRVFWYAP